MRARRRGRTALAAGFTLFELLTVMVLIAILSGIAVPILRRAVARADAARVVSDVNTVRLAAFQYLSDGGALPAAGAWGELPAELAGYLPEGFDFSYKGVEYAWSLLDAGAPAGAALAFPALRVWAYTAAVPLEVRGAGQGQGIGQGQGGGRGQGQGKGQGQGQGGGSSGGASGGSTGGSTGGATGGSSGGSDPVVSLDGAVGVLWVRYAADDPIARALQGLAGASAFWTPTQMMFVLGG
jgi:prepilin-type N-terminal cleavage/methylation domain-containing protein